MIFLIKIDRRTLKKNPNAGSTVSYLPGLQSSKFEYSGKFLPNYLIDGRNCYITETNYGDGIICGEMIGEVSKKLMKCFAEDLNMHISISQETNRIDHLPEPDYFYEYKKTKVQCNSCGVWFDHHKLLSDEIMDVYSDRICPECGKFDCCQLEYESL